MSRNFGVRGRQQPPRPRLLSPAAHDLLAGLGWLAFMIAVYVVLHIEFPDGLANLGKYHVAVIAGDRIITVFN